MERPPMRAHELAMQLVDIPDQIVNGRLESQQLGRTIEHAQKVLHELTAGKFEQEFGYVTFRIVDTVPEWEDPDPNYIAAIHPIFNDLSGQQIPLGAISRLWPYGRLGTASVLDREGKAAPLLPYDPRWNAVVGTVERAVAQCWAEKFGDSDITWQV